MYCHILMFVQFVSFVEFPNIILVRFGKWTLIYSGKVVNTFILFIFGSITLIQTNYPLTRYITYTNIKITRNYYTSLNHILRISEKHRETVCILTRTPKSILGNKVNSKVPPMWCKMIPQTKLIDVD